MISFRNRRATILPSTLTFALLCQAGLLSAQTPEGWPFEEKELNPSTPSSQAAPAPAPKSAVQQKLEELYKHDGRPLPDYMRNDTAPNAAPKAFNQQVSQQQQPSPMPAYPAQPLAPVASLSAPVASPWPTQAGPQNESQGSIRQQLSDYYASQGKVMPGTQPAWSSAQVPRQPVAMNAGQTPPTGTAAVAAPQPRLIDRLNPFRGFWHKDDSTKAPPETASTYRNATSQTTSSQNGPNYWTQPAPAPAPVRPQIVQMPANPAPRLMTVDLGPSAPISLIARPVDASPKPIVATAHPADASPPTSVASRPVQAPTAAAPAKTIASPPPAPAVAAKTPSEPPAPAAPVRPSAAAGVAVVQDDQAHSAGKSEADKRSAAYTGVTLHDADDAVTAPDPMKVSTADVSEPADRPRVAPMPAVDVEQPNKPSPQPSVAAETSSPSGPAAEQHPPEANRVAEEPPAKPRAPADPTAPKAFNERQVASEPLQRPEETAAKMHAIGERVGQRGLKGFCPVALRDQRQLVDAVPVYSSTFESRRYYFSSVEAKGRFDFYPEKYAPIAAGTDVVVKKTSDQSVEGTLDFAVWYKDRLFLFSSPESLEAFSLNPAPYAGPYLNAH